MIIFTVPKPFRGKYATIQENAIESWLAIKPKPKIILLGNEDGIADIARQKKLLHIIKIKRNKNGTPLLNDIFKQTQKEEDNEVFMYINTDVILLDSPIPVIAILKDTFNKFLAIGRRYEIDINRRMRFVEMKKIINPAKLRLKSNSWMDYFIFTRGVFDTIPPFALGRTFWDKWLVWQTLQKQIPVIDIANQMYAIHQTHSYAMNSKTNFKTVWAGEEALENLHLAGGWSHSSTVSDASFKLIKGVVYPQKQKVMSKRFLLDIFPALWPFFLKIRLLREKYSSIVYKE